MTLTLTDVVTDVTTRGATKVDGRATMNRIRFNEETGKLGFDDTEKQRLIEEGLDNIVKNEYGFTDIGWQQLCASLGIPNSEWMWKNPNDIKKKVLEHWAKEGDKRKTSLFRTIDDKIRAVLSPSYVPLDDTELFKAVQHAFKKVDNQVRMWNVYPEFTRLKIVMPDLTRECTRKNGVKETFKVGVFVRNSEIGQSSVVVAPFIYRLSCTNDLVIEENASLQHQHRWIHSSYLFKLVENALAQVIRKSETVLDAFEESDTEDVDDPSKALKEVLATGKFSQKIQEEAEKHLQAHYDKSKFAVLNAITSTARSMRDAGSVLSADRLEAYAGKLLFKKVK